jgi:hypothetical protein
MIRRARDKRLRKFAFTEGQPVVWNPTQVINPECGIPFTDITAWHFIADQLESGCKVKTIVLENPPGAAAHEVILPGATGHGRIYIKLQLHHRFILGRSFHISTR